MPHVPTKMKLAQVVDYLEKTYGVKKSRQAIYLWKNTGVGGVKLHVTKIGGTYYTTEGWVDEFVRNTGTV